MFDQISTWISLDKLGWRSLADILVLSLGVYQLLRLIRGTRAVQMLYGMFSIAVAYYLTGPGHLLELPAVHRVLGGALVFIPFAVVILFQNHIRRLLATVGRNPLRGLAHPAEGPERIAEEIGLAVVSLASRRHGALIVLEREQGLRTFVEAGIELDALVSHDILTTIFNPASALHDGAVIINEGRVRAASCFLPLTSSPPLTREFGSRHRAAIGITEETDAVAIIVSEERGTVSIARVGRIEEDLDATELDSTLKSILVPAAPLFARLPWPGWTGSKGNGAPGERSAEGARGAQEGLADDAAEPRRRSPAGETAAGAKTASEGP